MKKITHANLKSLTLRALLTSLLLLIVCSAGAQRARAQGCPTQGTSGGESIAAWVTVGETGAPAADQVVPKGTRLRIDSVATANGSCTACAVTYQRLVDHTNVLVDLSTTALSGRYNIGRVQGMEGGSVKYYHVLDSENSNSTGPVYYTAYSPGTYRFQVNATIQPTVCNLQPNTTATTTVVVYVGESDDDPNKGEAECNAGVGEPVNVTNGNMYLRQTDYDLPGAGGGLNVTRTYNSQSKRAGIFGYGWSSEFDQSIVPYAASLLKLTLPDGRAVYYGQAAAGEPFLPRLPAHFGGRLVRNADGGYTLTFRDGTAQEFNAAGKLTARVDRNGNRTSLTYDSAGKLVTITAPSGQALTLTYDAYGAVGTLSDQMGAVATYTHASLGRLTAVTYPDGSKYKFADAYVNGVYRVTTVRDALDNVVESHAYDAQGRALTSERHGGVERYTLAYVGASETHVTDALGHVTKYFFDRSRGRNVVTRVEGNCACGGSRAEAWTYDARLNVKSRTDALGRTTLYAYDADDNLQSETTWLGTARFTHDQFGQVLTAVDPLGGETRYEYDARGNLLSTTDALGGVTAHTFDARGLPLTITDPRGNTTARYEYDANGNLARETDALGNSVTYAHDARGRLVSVIDPAGSATAYAYDPAGRVRTVTRPDGSTLTYLYDLAGRRTKVTDARGNSTTFAYDAAYRLLSATDAAGNVVRYGYDVMSRRTSVTDALGRVTDYAYDEFDRLSKITHPEATAGAGRLEEQFAHDAAGNLVRKTDTAGRVTSYAYDASDRVTKVVDPALAETRFEYDARSNLTALVDAAGQRYEFSYDNLGRRRQAMRAGAAASYAYDASGNLTRRTDYNGAATTYTYDAANRLTRAGHPDSSSTAYAYDSSSRLASATNASGTVSFAYDNRGRLGGAVDVWGQAVGYSYDAEGNRTRMSLDSYGATAYQYDAADRLTRITDGLSGVFTFAHDAEGRPTSRAAANGLVTDYQYDALGRLTRLRHSRGTDAVADFGYQLDAAGRITAAAEAAGARAFSYDARGHLTSASHPDMPAESYAYDAVGNRTASHRAAAYAYQPFNRLVSADSTSQTYDANGNLTSKTDASGTWLYFWDGENRLTRVQRPDGFSVSYRYDALGRRVERGTGGGRWTRYSYDGDEVVLDRDSDRGVTEYLNGPGVDRKLWQRSNGGAPAYFVQDHAGSTRALLGAQGELVGSARYDSFGDAAGSLPTRYGYTGREHDPDTGLVYFRARWYDSRQGRFLSEDPVGHLGGVNLYEYVGNDPVNFVDPSGLAGTSASNTGGPTTLKGGVREVRELRKTYSRVFPCSQSPAAVIGGVKRDFSLYANYTGFYRPLIGIGGAAVGFGPGGGRRAVVRKGDVIDIRARTAVVALPFWYGEAPHVKVRVTNDNPNSFTLTTLKGHVLHPADITFRARRAGRGEIEFTVEVDAEFAGFVNRAKYHLGGGALEDGIWGNLLRNVERYSR